MSADSTYLGDGLYADCDRWGTITLRTQRAAAEHFVVLDPRVLAAFEAWLNDLRAAKAVRS